MNNRYRKQVILPDIGQDGQSKLSSTKVLIIGCGGLGNIVAPYLAGAGVGDLVLMDHDHVSLSNLHRQVFYAEEDIGEYKAESLSKRVRLLNSEINVTSTVHRLSKNNIHTIIDNSDLVVECTDDLMTKYLVNDYCHLKSKPLVYGGIDQYIGYAALFTNRTVESVQLRDVFPLPDTNVKSCSEVGVIGSIAGMIGLYQVNLALNYLLDLGDIRQEVMYVYDSKKLIQTQITLKKNFTEDMNALFDNSTYVMDSCDLPKISAFSLDDLDVNRCYTLQGSSNIFGSELKSDDFDLLPEGAIIICDRGIRSSTYIEEYLDIHPSRSIYSLSGGLMSLK